MIFLDVETTGLKPDKHSIIGIGALNFEAPANRFNVEFCRPFEGAEVSPKALEVNGADPAWFNEPSSGPTVEEAVRRFVDWADEQFKIPMQTKSGPVIDRLLGGENVASFDLKFIEATMERYGIAWKHKYQAVDLFTVFYTESRRTGEFPARVVTGGELNAHTDEILRFVGLPAEPKPHKALIGAMGEAEAYSRLAFGKNLLPEYTQYPIPNSVVEGIGTLRRVDAEVHRSRNTHF
ncbi:exonuclease domain-containing protein [Candidatus Marsarchaeota archaeon]|nr:exonuclease domain-containing protein [Candidatus Marsarchaeota archaeon]